VFPNLPIGGFSLEVSATGFNNYLQSGIILQVGNKVQVNVTLQLGAVSQEVHVSANAAMVEMQDTSISQVVDQRRIVDLPLNGRQATDLILLSGGAVVAPNAAGRVVSSHDMPNSVGVSIGGGQINGNNYLLDGGDHNDVHSAINLPFPLPDALQEFSVQTSGLSARYGVQPGGVVNAVTKSGTNQLHGNLLRIRPQWEFQCAQLFRAGPRLTRRNQFGGTLGGRIIKDKLFFFNGFRPPANVRRRRKASPTYPLRPPSRATSALESAACQSRAEP
jgi:hypothetical protein